MNAIASNQKGFHSIGFPCERGDRFLFNRVYFNDFLGFHSIGFPCERGDPEVKKAIEQWGSGDDLTLTEFGNYVYEYESGGLLEKPVREALEVLEALDEERDQERDGEWDSNYHAICEIAEAYAAFANANALQAAEYGIQENRGS